MKIAIPLPFFHKHGGIERHTYELVSRLKNFHEIHIFCYDFIPIEGVVFHKVPGKFLPEMLRRLWWHIYIFFTLSKMKKDFDIILNNGCGQSLIQDAIITASVHNAWMNSFKLLKLKRFFFNPLHYITLLIEWINYDLHRYERILCISNFIKQQLIRSHRVYEKEIDVIYLGVNIEEFTPEKRKTLRDKARKKYNLSHEDKVILFPSHEWKRKGLDTILDLLTLNTEYKLLIVGNPSKHERKVYEEKIKNKNLKNRVIYAGISKNMVEAYSAADVLVFPSTFDAFALVVIEAMASGLPVITTPTVGASELITNGENGFIIKDWKDIEGINQYLSLLFKDQNFYEKISKNARETASKHNWDIVSKETEEWLKKVYIQKFSKNEFQ